MKHMTNNPKKFPRYLTHILALSTGLFLTQINGWASRAIPAEHSGVSVETLGVISENSLSKQIGLENHLFQMREITLQPGGTIKRHDHNTRPGLVWTLSGSWVEGRPSGEIEYPAGKLEALLEDENTDHWFFNDGSEPVKVVVCDIVPAS